MSHYDNYYDSQVGGGGGVEHVYTGSPYQRGHGGIGSFLKGLFRRALPFLKRGARAVGKEAFRAGVNIIDDVSENKATFKEALRTRARESGLNLKRKAEEKIESLMEGSGYKRTQRRRKRQSKVSRRRKRTTRKTKTGKTKTRKTKKKSSRVKKTRTNKNKIRSVHDIFGPA